MRVIANALLIAAVAAGGFVTDQAHAPSFISWAVGLFSGLGMVIYITKVRPRLG